MGKIQNLVVVEWIVLKFWWMIFLGDRGKCSLTFPHTHHPFLDGNGVFLKAPDSLGMVDLSKNGALGVKLTMFPAMAA